MTVELANEEHVSVNQVCKSCEIEIYGNKFAADLIPFKLGEFDVILGMNWISKHDAQIDCRNKKVILKMLDEKVVTFKGHNQAKKFLRIIEAKKLLQQGYMFPDELPGLPPDRELEFAINLAPGKELVSKSPYRMAPVEMKELEKQFEELLEKGMI
ncbi:uncharacterized protein LOC141679871 [Apium graveolens]|uniref:uncharacterized protein LOC141679871 n=1 Tax=Apium graveolens TaxID=4045 RepID=UPI003D7B99FC